MKRFVFGIIAILCVFALVMTSCSSSSSDSKPSQVTITFHLQGGALTGVTGDTLTRKVNKNAAIGAENFPGNPTKADANGLSYSFARWSKDQEGGTPDKTVDASTTFASNTHVYAIYTSYNPNTQATVTFHKNDGTDALVGLPIVVDKGGTLGDDLPAAPTREDFEFVGWATTDDATEPDFDGDTVINESMDVYAVWGESGGLPPVTLYPITGLGIYKPVILGDFTVSNSVTQKGWASNGTDDLVTDLTIGTVTGAKYLVLDMRYEPAGTVQFIWQGDSDDWGWNQTDITTNLGAAKEDLGVTINTIGDVVQLKIDIATVLGEDDYDIFITNTKVKLIIGAYNPDIAALGIERAWISQIPPPDPGPTEGTSIVESFNLANGWFAIFQFTLPDGKTWGDYKHVKADYKLADASKNVRARVFGNYTQSAIDNVRLGTYTNTATTPETFNVAVIDSWPSGDTGSWILDNTWANNVASSAFANNSYPEVKSGDWFTLFYPVLGSNPHGQWGNGGVSPEQALANNAGINDAYRYKEGRRPADTATGPFYLGLGFTGPSGDATADIKSQITNIVLYGDGVPDVIGKPLYIKKGSDLYRAFAGQLDGIQDTATGLFPNLNGGRPEWTTVSGSDLIDPVSYVEPSNIDITYDLNWPTADDSTGQAPTKVTLRAGDRFDSDQANLVPKFPTSSSSTPGNVFVFNGWFTTTETGGAKIVARWQFDEATTIYARWSDVAGAKITFDANGGTGTKADVYIEKTNGRLTAAQLDPSDITPPAGKVFGGWYKSDPATQGFDYKNYANMVKTSGTGEGFAGDTTVYAYWYTPVDVSSLTFNTDWVVEALGGARIDEEGYVIFAAGAQNAYLNGNANDTLLSVNWGTAVPTGTTLKITYKLLDMITPTPADGWVLDAALSWKSGYNSWSGTSGGNYASWDRTDQGSDKVITKPLDTFGVGTASKTGFSIQINGGDDANNHQTRAGYVYGIKIINIEILP